MALLDLAVDWAQASGAQLHVVTVDHGLRAEAAAEIALVAAACEARELPHDVLHWDWEGTGNLQAAGRNARYLLISDWARARGLAHVALGHTQDDLAETFLMRLAREAGSDGLSAMSAQVVRHGVTFLRPLLSLRRADLRAHLDASGQAWADDPSNDDDRFDRVKARAALAALEPLGIDVGTLSRVAKQLGTESAVIDKAVRAAAEGILTSRGGGYAMARADLAALDPEVRRRMLRRILTTITGGDYGPRRAALSDFTAALLDGGTSTLHGVIGFSERGTVWLAREAAKVAGPSTSRTWDGWRMAGPGIPGCTLRALGQDGLAALPDWRALKVPRRVLEVAPSAWAGPRLLAAPHANFGAGTTATRLRDEFVAGPDSH